jgi:hypothetical protein
LRAFHGAARYRDLVSTSRDARDLKRAVAAGLVVRHVRGVYALPGAELAIVAARWCRGRLTAATALGAIPGFDTHQREVIHVEVPRNCSVKKARRLHGVRIVVHRHARGLHPDPADHPLVPPARAIAQMLRDRELIHAIAAADQALHCGLTHQEDIAAELGLAERGLVRWALDHVNPRAASPLETFARLALTIVHLECEVNPHIEGVGFVDLLVEGRLVIELDGFTYHSDPVAFIADRRRDRALQQLGYIVFRFARDEVVPDPRAIADEAERVLARAGPLPGGAPGPAPTMER